MNCYEHSIYLKQKKKKKGFLNSQLIEFGTFLAQQNKMPQPKNKFQLQSH